MTDSRDLITRLITNDSVERVGLYETFWTDTLKIWVDEGHLPSRTVIKNGNEEEQPEDPNMFFDTDMYAVSTWFDRVPIVGYEELIEETDEWAVKRDGAGAAFKYWKDRMGTPEHIDFLMTNRALWERDYRPHLLQLDRRRFDLEYIKAEFARGRSANKWIFYGHLFVWETLRASLGDVCMLESLALDQGWVHDFNRVYTDFYKTHFQYLIDEVGMPDAIWLYEDLGYKNRLFASPKMLEQLIFPYFAEMVEFFHDQGLPVVLHSCGKITQALPLIVDAGFDALNPMEVKAGCNIFEFAERYADKLAFIGGLDVRVLETNDRDIIRREVINIIEGMKSRNARYVFGTDHSVTPRVTYDSYRYAVDVYREHMQY